jgi:hypothetical protein
VSERKRAQRDSSDRRYAPRENLDPIEIRGLTSLDHKTLLSRTGCIVEASKNGFLLQITRKDLVPPEFKDALSLSEFEGDQVILMINPMNLEIGGRIARTKRLSKDVFEIAVDYSADAPEYWREILLEMLPRGRDYVD